MTKFLMMLLGLVIIAIVVLSITNTAKSTSSDNVTMSAQQTERVRLTEQTKQEAAQLRTEESLKVLNTLAFIFAPLLLLGTLTLILIMADGKTSRNRVWEIQELARIERNRIREEQRLAIIEQQRMRLEIQQLYYLPILDKNRVVVDDVWVNDNVIE